MRRARLWSWIGACALCVPPSLRAQEPQGATAASAPDIALVLSSGGVRGLAHVGVLRALEEQCIPIDMIVGSEWGALVGGLYAAGLAPDEIERALLSPDWSAALQDRVPRRTLSFRAKQEDREFLVDLPLGIDEHGLILPPGLFVGSRLRLELARLTLGALGARRFELLPIAFRALATDLETGEPVTLDHGSLTLALEASLSTPVLRAPVRWGERSLVSGAVAAPLPIEVALAAGARTLIVVDLGTPPLPGSTWNFFTVGERVLDAAGERNAARSRALLRSGDVLCTPAVGDLDLSDAENGREIVARGRAAAQELRERLAVLASPRERFEQRLLRRRAQLGSQPVVERVRVDPGCALSERAVRARMDVREGEPLDVTTAQEDLARLYGLRIFQRVDLDLVPTPEGGRDLVVRTEETPSAPLHWRSGLTGEFSAGNEIDFVIGAGVRYAPTDAWGSEARALVEVGNRVRLLLDYRQALEPAGRWFLSPYASWEHRPVQVDTGGGAVTEYRVEELELGLDLVREFGNDWEARAGVLHRTGDSSLESGGATPFTTADDGDFGESGLRFGLTCDSLDHTGFPTAGSYLAAEWFLPAGGLADGEDETVRARGDRSFGWDQSSLTLGAEFDTVVGDPSSVQSFFPLGGFLRLSGLQPDAISGPTAVLARAVYLRTLTPRGLESRPFTWHAGASAELGNVFAEPSDVTFEDLLPAGSLFVGVSTLIGPAYLGVGLAEGGESSVFFVFGGAF